MKKIILVISDSNSEKKVRDIIIKAHDEGKLIFIDTETQDGQIEITMRRLKADCLNRMDPGTLINLPGPENQVYILLTGSANSSPGQKSILDKAELMKEDSFAEKYSLTQQEMTVLSYMIKGLAYTEIAEILCISIHTVKNHISNIFIKLDVKKRSAAIYKYFGHKYEMN